MANGDIHMMFTVPDTIELVVDGDPGSMMIDDSGVLGASGRGSPEQSLSGAIQRSSAGSMTRATPGKVG